MLSLPSEIITLLDSGRYAVRLLLRFDLDGGPQGLWNDVYPVEVGGVTYEPLAGNMKVDAIPGSSKLNADKVNVTVTGLDPSVSAALDANDWHQRPAMLLLAFLNDAGEVAHTVPRFSGFVDAAPLSDAAGGQSTLRIVIESNNRGLSRGQGRTRSDADQRAVGGSTDGFFKHTATATTNSEIYWGRNGPQSPFG